MRQVGLAMAQFHDTHGGHWPETSHTSQPDPVTGQYDHAWIYTIGPYMEDVDAIRICPSDLAGQLRLLGKGTSYTMNGYLSRESLPPFDNIRKLAALSQTIVTFELSENKDAGAMRSQKPSDIDVFNDHVHSFNWFIASNIRNNLVYTAISAEIAVDRHSGSAHYLYADGHVSLISSEQIQTWVSEQFDFSLPPSF